MKNLVERLKNQLALKEKQHQVSYITMKNLIKRLNTFGTHGKL